MNGQIIPFPKIPRLNPGQRVTRIDSARAALETCEFFGRCETAARDAIDEGDMAEFTHQLCLLASFQISDQAPGRLNNERRMLMLDLIDYATDPANAPAIRPSN
jgi:hypothetical protein